MNAREQAYYDSYMHAKHCTIFGAYKSPSAAKKSAWTSVVVNAESKAEGFAILSYNCHFFTVGYLAIINNIPCLVVITPYHKYGVRLTVDEYRAARDYNYNNVD